MARPFFILIFLLITGLLNPSAHSTAEATEKKKPDLKLRLKLHYDQYAYERSGDFWPIFLPYEPIYLQASLTNQSKTERPFLKHPFTGGNYLLTHLPSGKKVSILCQLSERSFQKEAEAIKHSKRRKISPGKTVVQ